MAVDQFTPVSEFELLVGSDGQASAQVTGLYVYALSGAPDSRYADVSEVALHVSLDLGVPVTQVSEVAVLVSWVTGPRAVFNQRAWGFTFDRHPFYVLHLGTQGTFVYDVSTEQWAEWSTAGIGTWNMEQGVEWNGGVYAGDQQLPTIWRLNPDSFIDDDFRTMTRVVTGGIPVTGRDTLRTGGFILSTSPQTAVSGDVPTVQLEISDDNGKSFRSMNVNLSVSGVETQEFAWRSLGTIKAPGRVYRITDTGGLVRINGADQAIVGEK